VSHDKINLLNRVLSSGQIIISTASLPVTFMEDDLL